jgi:hypothetical protein
VLTPTFTAEDVRRFAFRFEPDRVRSTEFRAYVAATSLLIEWLGFSWAEREVFPAGGNQFLRLGNTPDPRLPNLRHADRVTALADMLFNLQAVDGIEQRAERIRDMNVETGVAELEGARILRQAGFFVRFVSESGVAGTDYDIETFVHGQRVACESKCKVETTEPSDNRPPRWQAPVSNQYVPQSHPFSSRRPRLSASATPSSSS